MNEKHVLEEPNQMVIANGLLFNIAISLSAVGVLFVFIVSAFFKTYKRPLGFIVLMISIADLLFIFPTSALFKDKTDQICAFAAAISQYGTISSFFWVACFAHALKSMFCNVDDQTIRRNLRKYFIISQFTPILFSIYDYFIQLFKAYNDATTEKSYCYHHINPGSFDLPFAISLSIPALLTAGYITYCYCVVSSVMNGLFRSKHKFISLMLFPVLLIISWMPMLVYQIIITFFPKLMDETSFEVLFNLMLLQGFFNALAYGVSHRLLNQIKESWCRCFRRKRIGCDEKHTSPEGIRDSDIKAHLIGSTRSVTESTGLPEL